MSSTQQALGFRQPAAIGRSWRPPWHGGLRGSELSWAIAFFVPYGAVFLAFVVYPVAYGLWLGSSPALYAELFENPRYLTTVVNTLLLVGIGVNVKMFLAFLMSGFFIRRGRWIKALLVLYMLPWALPALPAFLSLHWMLIGYGGFLNSALELLFGIDGPIWFNSYWLALGANVFAYIWKWLPFWTLIFLAGRMAIPQDIYEAAAVDGATGIRRFAFVTFPHAGEPVPGLYAALHAVDHRRLHHAVFRIQRRARFADGGAGHLWLPRGIRPWLPRGSAWPP